MPDRARLARAGVAAAALAFAAPLPALVVQAFADEWRSPDVVPQRLGLRGVREAFSATALEALGNSLLVAVVVVVLALALGWPAARALGERRGRRGGVVLVVLALPLLVPSYATGTGLTEWFLRLDLADSLVALVLAHLVLALPYVVLVLVPAFGPALREAEEAAAVHGLNRRRRLWCVTLPAVRPTLAAAALLGFLVSWSEYGSSLAVGGGRPMLPLVLLPFVGTDPQVAAALALLFLLPAVAALVVALRGVRRPL